MSKSFRGGSRLPKRSVLEPGTLYNAGNLIGLLAGLTVSVIGAASAVDIPESTASILTGYFLGNWAALLTTVATMIFFASGTAYRRELESGRTPFWGDLLSGVGATVLGAALMALSSPILAATSGFLHAAGKFGSAATARGAHFTRCAIGSDLFRLAVLASRVPALLLAVSQLIEQTSRNTRFLDFVLPAAMLACYSLWSLADIALLQPWPRSSSQAVLRRQ